MSNLPQHIRMSQHVDLEHREVVGGRISALDTGRCVVNLMQQHYITRYTCYYLSRLYSYHRQCFDSNDVLLSKTLTRKLH